MRTHAFWLGSSVFDGARAFEGVTPDLDRHCARVNRSAVTMFLKPLMSVEAMIDLTREGMRKFKARAELYIRPMYWAERGGPTSVQPDPESTRFCLSLYEASLLLVQLRKPGAEASSFISGLALSEVRGSDQGAHSQTGYQ